MITPGHFSIDVSIRRSGALVQVDAISEFKVQKGFFTGRGQTPGVVSVVTKQGTNEIHGSAWFFHRNDNLDARGFFDKELGEFRQHQWGFEVGGPALKDKLFWYVSLEGLDSSRFNTQFLTVPPTSFLRGDFSSLSIPIMDPMTGEPFPNNQIPSNRIHKWAQLYMEDGLIPAPNVPGATANNFTGAAPRIQTDRKWIWRGDWQITENDKFFARIIHSDSQLYDSRINKGANVEYPLYGRNAVVNWTHVFANNLILDARAGLNRAIMSLAQNLERDSDPIWSERYGIRNINTTRTCCWRPWKIAQMWPSKIAHFWFLKRLLGGSHKEDLERFAERAGFCYVASLPGGGDAMFGSDKRVLLRHYLEQGMSKAAIARQLGVSRRTVYYWIQKGQLHRGGQEEPVQYGPRGPGRSKLDPYKAIIDARLAEYPKLTATRLYREVRKAGYGGGYGQVKRYVRQARPRAPEEPVQRFETAPGHQGQVDFADFRLPWGKRYALIVVLGYSRLMWFRYYERQTMPVVMRGLEASFDYFGGVPGELLFDQMKSVIVRDRREEGGRLIENREFVRFSRHWGFRVRACRPYRAQTKGKVERPIRYLRESFFYGRDFVSDADLNARARKWREEEANVRNHGTLKERPVDRFEREREYLIPLAPWPYHSNVVPVPEPPAPSLPAANWPRMVDVERRPLTEYARLTGGVA